ncbi:MAG: HlyD family efflux transporter periplasmic adaptor subunit [Bacteroidetes bacterium]|nr:MAG: HlyD family efflux transporter periplasmic adaptor subunit [Bacteroidota bacterium]
MINISQESISKDIDIERLYAIKLVNVGSKKNTIVRWLAGIFLSFILAMFLPWQQNIDGNGIVTALNPSERPQTIQTLIAGKIEKWYVPEGKLVNKGDTILTITEIKDKFLDPQMIDRMEKQLLAKESSILSKKEKVKALENQIRALRQGLTLGVSKAINKIEQSRLYVSIDSVELIAAKADNDISKNQMDRQQKLFDQGLVSLTLLEQRNLKFQQTNAKYMSANSKFSASQAGLQSSEIELNSVKAEYLDKISKAESDRENTLADVFDSESMLFKTRIDLSNMQLRNNLYVIRAPQDGYVVKAIKQGLGETVKEGEEIATIMPSKSSLAVELYIKPVDLPLIEKGTKVRVQFDGWPAIVFAGWPGASAGTYGGVVQVVDYVNSTNGKFRLLVSPDPEEQAWPDQIRIGTGVMGWAMLKNVMVGYEVWRQFNGFPPDFTKKIPKKYKSTSKSSKDADEDDK